MTEPKIHEPRSMKIEQVKQIYDYTKFHISFYFPLLAALGGFAKYGSDLSSHQRRLLLTLTFVLLFAGVAGALVASRIVYGPWGKRAFLIKESWFWRKRVNWPKSWNWWWSIADLCLIVEHYGFWLALAIAIADFAFWTRL